MATKVCMQPVAIAPALLHIFSNFLSILKTFYLLVFFFLPEEIINPAISSWGSFKVFLILMSSGKEEVGPG